MENKFEKEVCVNLIHYPIDTLGPGRRIGIWFQGCKRKCRGCIADYSHKFLPEYMTTVGKIIEEIKKYAKSNPDGLTISGGEPFLQPEALKIIISESRNLGIKDVMVYTGYTYRHLTKKYPDILNMIDCLVDGKFVFEKPTAYLWKGSDNQKMYILSKNENLIKIYEKFGKRKNEKRNLQILEKNDNIYVIGIPDSKDAEVIKHGFN